MPRSASFVLFPWVLFVLQSTTGMAQTTVHLKLMPDRMRHARKVELEAIAKNDSLGLAEAWYLYGKTYVLAGDFRTAQAYFMKALRVHEPRGDSYELSRLYIRLSESEGRLGHLDESFRLAGLSLAMARRIRSDIALIRAYGTLGQLYEKKWSSQLVTDRGKYNRVLDYYRKAESLCHKTNDSMGIAEVSSQLGVFFTKTSDRQAIPYLEKAVYLFGLGNKDGNRIDAMIHLVSAFLMANETERAFQTLNKAEKLYTRRKLDDYVLRVGLERQYTLYYRTTNQWEAAYEHLGKLNTLEKSQLLADNDGTITRLNVEYETEKKEALLTLQRNELTLRTENLQTQQRFTMAALALLVMSAGMSLVFFRLYRKNQRISRQNQELVKEQNHRVKNNLQVVSSLLSLQAKRLTDEAAKKAIEESRLRVESMAILHRRLYDGNQLARVDLREFIPELVSVVLESYGYTDVQTQFEIDTIDLSADKAVPIGLILTELTTNACKYAFPVTETPRYLIRCSRHKQLIKLEVTDNGPGLDGPGLDGPGLDGSGWTDIRPDDDAESETAWLGGAVNSPVATRRQTFGRQLIQTQVEQLYGTARVSAPSAILSTGVVFTLTFTTQNSE